MKIDYIFSYVIRDNILTLYFDKDFKQIRYIKMESSNSNKTSESLDCDEMEVSYSKRRKSFNVCLSDNSDQVIILITQFDKRQTLYGYHIKRQIKNEITTQDLMAKGMISLLSGSNLGSGSVGKDVDEYSIKNQNIFAKIKRKGSTNNNGVATIM